MYSGGNKIQRIIRIIIDCLNVILGAAAIVLAVMVFLDTQKNMWMFPIIFGVGGMMNLITGVKYFMTDRKISGIVSEVVAVVLFVIAYVSFLAVGGK